MATIRLRLGVRRRYRNDVRLDSRYAKIGWEWCHVLVSVSVGATATTAASARGTLRQGGEGVTGSALGVWDVVAVATTDAETITSHHSHPVLA